MTYLRKRMLEELQRRNYSPATIRPYLYAVEDFARYFGKSPDKLSQEHLRQYQLHLINGRKLTVKTIVGRISALRFFFVKVLRRPYREIDLVYPKRPERLPIILSEAEVARLIESASTAFHRVILMTLHGTELRREELCRLRVTDVDGERLVIHVHQGKGHKVTRQFGFMANAQRSASLELCRRLLRMAPVISSTDSPATPSAWFCPNCRGPMVVVERFTAEELWMRKSVPKSSAPHMRLLPVHDSPRISDEPLATYRDVG